MKTILEIRKLISSVYWDLKKDVEQMDTSDHFDVGYMTSLSTKGEGIINKKLKLKNLQK
jgi:hypothetical protein